MWQFCTALACSYPLVLGMEVGELAAEVLMVRDHARIHGEDVPMLSPCDDMGNPMLQATFDDHGLLIGEAAKFCDDGVPRQFDEWTQEGSVEFEPDSGGAWKGMTTEEHMRFAEDLPHQGHKVMDVDVPEELVAALSFARRTRRL